MSEIKVNKISPRAACGTVQLGDSGDTITIPAGATITNSGTQTGFGRTGTVNWQTAIKTSGFTAANGEGYFIDTNSGGFTVNLPAGSAGDIVAFKDYRNTFDTGSLTVSPNGTDKIGGVNANAVFSTESQSVTLIFTDSTRGWLDIHDSTTSAVGTRFLTATGGTVTTCGNFKIHTFTGPGTFCVSCAGDGTANAPSIVDYLVVAGGGGAGAAPYGMGGAGGGGFRESKAASSPTHTTPSYTASPLANPTGITVTATGFPVTVGGGGSVNGNGSNSSAFPIISAGGGAGGSGAGGSSVDPGSAGGSGGGGSGYGSSAGSGGAGNTPPVSPPQGSSGGSGAGQPGVASLGGGGGGATAGGSNATHPGGGGPGGAGAGTLINPATGEAGPGPSRYYSGGGGGATDSGTPSTGGIGGGGDQYSPTAPSVGVTNTGGGGGGRQGGCGGAGGSGIVVIRYKFQ